jgi:N-acetylmuramic acid 6-phosphate etherase
MKKNDRSAEIRKLATERRNRAAAALDTRSAREIARIINAEDRKVAPAVGRVLPQIARAIDAAAQALDRGGRLIYVGAGTSGRIAALDASECPPTFGVAPEAVRYVIAGGEAALGRAAEYNEDSGAAGARDLAQLRPGKRDVVIGLAASGRTPYTLAAVQYARRKGARTVAITCAPGSPLARAAHIALEVDAGPEVVSGSTRMKAGTAQKMVLNMISTGAMARLGYVYGNLMVNVGLKNEKLVERGVALLEEITGAKRAAVEAALRAAKQSVPVALVMLKTGLNASAAARQLQRARGNVRRAIESS